MFHPYAPRKHQKTSHFLMFSGGDKWIQVEHWLQMGLINFIISTCFFQKQSPRYVLQNKCSATGAKNLKKPVQEFIFSKNERRGNNELLSRYFVFVELLCGWLSLVNIKRNTTI